MIRSKRKNIATCGHVVYNGIDAYVEAMDDMGNIGTSFGTYCAECLLDAYKNGTLETVELKELIHMVIDYADACDECDKHEVLTLHTKNRALCPKCLKQANNDDLKLYIKELTNDDAD